MVLVTFVLNSAWRLVDSIQYRLIQSITHSTSPCGGWMDSADMSKTEFPLPPRLPSSQHTPAWPAPSPSHWWQLNFPVAQAKNIFNIFLCLSFPTATLSGDPLILPSKCVQTPLLLSIFTTTILIQATIYYFLPAFLKNNFQHLPVYHLFF